MHSPTDAKRWLETWSRAEADLHAIQGTKESDRQMLYIQLSPHVERLLTKEKRTTTSGLVQLRQLLDGKRA